MGSLAKFGIIGGKAVLLDSVPGLGRSQSKEDFARSCLAKFGFSRIADRVAAGLPLNMRDIEMLLTKASLPVLMKLVELGHPGEEVTPPEPLVMLPLSSWSARYQPTEILELSQGLLKGIRHKNVRVVIDEIDYDKLDGELFEVLREISACRPGITMVGPSVDDLVTWMVSSASRQSEGESPRFENVLHRLKDAGLERMMPSSVVDVLKTVREAGMPASLMTNVLGFSTPLELAKELMHVNEIAQQLPIDCWMPGFDESKLPARMPDRGTLDFQLLRLLAVGSLCLPSIPYRRASTRYFSMEAIQFSRHCGANDFGFGAVNEMTARTMHLERIDRLRRAVGAPARRTARAVGMDCPFPQA